MVVEGSTTKEVFEAYVEHFPGSTLSSGQLVVMDNLTAYNDEKVRELIGARTKETLVEEAIGTALDAVIANDTRVSSLTAITPAGAITMTRLATKKVGVGSI